jgi:hypothetical protein
MQKQLGWMQNSMPVITTAAMNNSSMMAIMKQTGHRSEGMVRKYIRDGSLFRENAAANIGL